jgi:hypothetical protein
VDLGESEVREERVAVKDEPFELRGWYETYKAGHVVVRKNTLPRDPRELDLLE